MHNRDPGAALFVYGSLRAGAATEHAQRLVGEAGPPTPAVWRGRLYDLGAYPGAVAALDGRVVVGDLYHLHEPVRTLAWLDDYEDLGDPRPGAPRFVREPHRVGTGDGAWAAAWLYRYTGPVRTDRLVPDGDWLAHLARRDGPL